MPFREQPYFEYIPLDLASREFRLITLEPGAGDAPIRCALNHHHLFREEDLEYPLLSYEWGSLNELRWIWLSSRRFYVQPNLLLALRA